MKALLLAGEESGVLYADRIRAELLKECPDAEIRGYGDFGFRVEDLAVMGFGAVLRKLFYFLRVRRTMRRVIDAWRPDVVCTVDYPGLNLKLAAYAKRKGIRTVHVVCPQVWAWKKGRIPKIEAALDKLCCFFPFEPALFKPGFAEFVGHPLADEMGSSVPSASRRQALARTAPASAGRGDRDGTVLAVLPGSRMGEIEKHMPTLMEVMRGLATPRGGGASGTVKVIIPAANDRAYSRISAYLSDVSSSDPRSPIPVSCSLVRGGAREILRQADAAIVASGTATLEAALAGCPTVLVYRVGSIFYLLAKVLIRGIRHVGLANIIAEKAGVPCPMPELLQADFTADNVLHHVVPWLTDASENEKARKALCETMKFLKSDGDSMAKITRFLI